MWRGSGERKKKVVTFPHLSKFARWVAKIDPNEKRKRMEEYGEKREDGSEIGRK